MDTGMKKLLFLLLALTVSAPAFAQTQTQYYTVPTIAALKAMTTSRPAVVQVVDSNPGIFNLSAGACAAADDIFQVQPTSGTTVCYTRMATGLSAGNDAMRNGVATYGLVGDDSTDNTTAFNAAVTYMNANGGYTFLPRGVYRTGAVNSLTCKGCGFVGEGSASTYATQNTGPASGVHGSIIRRTTATGNTFTVATTAYGTVFRDIGFWPVPFTTAGAEILDQGFNTDINTIACSYTYKCIKHGGGSNGSTSTNIRMFAIWGDAAIQVQGTTDTISDWAQGIVISNIMVYQPTFNEEPTAANTTAAWATGTTYAQNKITFANGYIWQATVGGTSAGAGTGPTIPAYATAGAPTTQYVTDGTVQWRMLMSSGLSCLNFDGSVVVAWAENAQLTTCNAGMTVTNSIATTIPPQTITLSRSLVDHNVTDGIAVSAGYVVRVVDSDLVLAALGYGFNGTSMTSTLFIEGNKVWSNALGGVLLPAITNLQATVKGNRIVGNSVATANTYDGLTVGNATKVVVEGNIIGAADGAAAGTQRYGISIGASADNFSVIGNVLANNGTGMISNAAGTGSTKVIFNANNASDMLALSTGSTTTRSLATRFAETKNVLDYGADNTGVASSTAAFDAAYAALSATGGVIRFPSGTYKFDTAPTAVLKSGTYIQCDGQTNTVLSVNYASGDFLKFGSNAVSTDYVGLSDCTISAGTTRTLGAYINIDGAGRNAFERVRMTGAFVGINIDSYGNQTETRLVDIIQENFALGGTGYILGKNSVSPNVVNGVYMSRVISANVPTGIEFYYADGIMMESTQFYLASNSIKFLPALGQTVSHVLVDKGIFDSSSSSGIVFLNTTGMGTVGDITFQNSAFNTNGTATSDSAIVISATAAVNGLQVKNSYIENNTGYAINLLSGTNAQISSNMICYNSTAGVGAVPGIRVAAGVGTFQILNNIIGACGFLQPVATNRQSYAITVDAGGSDQYFIQNNYCPGNVTGGLSDGGTGTFKNTLNGCMTGAAAPTGTAAGTLTGTTLASNVVTSSLTSVGTLTGGATGAGFTVALGTSTISGTLPQANDPALTGDITKTAGNAATTLATVASAGTTGSSTAIPVVTINAKGLTTGITTAAVVAPAGTLSGATLASGVTASSLTSLGTQAANLLFTDNTYDIGANGATRPRDLWLSRNGRLEGDLVVIGKYYSTNGTVTAPVYSNGGYTNSGMWFPAAGTLAFSAGGTEFLRSTTTLVTVPIATDFTSTVTMANDQYLRWKDSGGTARNVLQLNSGGGLSLINNSGGTGGPVIIYSGSTEAFRANASSVTIASGITLNATLASTAQTNTVCYNSGTGLFTYQTWATGCLASSARFKENISAKSNADALKVVTSLEPVTFNYKKSADMGSDKHNGFIAEQVVKVAPDLVVFEKDGKTPRAVKYQEMAPYFAGAIRELKAANDNLKAEIEQLKKKVK